MSTEPTPIRGPSHGVGGVIDLSSKVQPPQTPQTKAVPSGKSGLTGSESSFLPGLRAFVTGTFNNSDYESLMSNIQEVALLPSHFKAETVMKQRRKVLSVKTTKKAVKKIAITGRSLHASPPAASGRNEKKPGNPDKKATHS